MWLARRRSDLRRTFLNALYEASNAGADWCNVDEVLNRANLQGVAGETTKEDLVQDGLVEQSKLGPRDRIRITSAGVDAVETWPSPLKRVLLFAQRHVPELVVTTVASVVAGVILWVLLSGSPVAPSSEVTRPAQILAPAPGVAALGDMIFLHEEPGALVFLIDDLARAGVGASAITDHEAIQGKADRDPKAIVISAKYEARREEWNHAAALTLLRRLDTQDPATMTIVLMPWVDSSLRSSFLSGGASAVCNDVECVELLAEEHFDVEVGSGGLPDADLQRSQTDGMRASIEETLRILTAQGNVSSWRFAYQDDAFLVSTRDGDTVSLYVQAIDERREDSLIGAVKQAELIRQDVGASIAVLVTDVVRVPFGGLSPEGVVILRSEDLGAYMTAPKAWGHYYIEFGIE